MIDKSQLEIISCGGEGYLPLIQYGEWKVAELRYCDELIPENISKFQRHNKTDEVFVLLSGHCTLFLGGNGSCVGCIEAQPMEPLKIYNVRCGTWHSHTLSPDATVLIVENADTCDDNSTEQMLTETQRKSLMEKAKQATSITSDALHVQN